MIKLVETPSFVSAADPSAASAALGWLDRVPDQSVEAAMITLPHRLDRSSEEDLAIELARVLRPTAVCWVHGAGITFDDAGWDVRFCVGKLWLCHPWRCPQSPGWVAELDPFVASDREFSPSAIEQIVTGLPTGSIVIDLFARAPHIARQVSRSAGTRVLTVAPVVDPSDDEPAPGCPPWATDMGFVESFRARLQAIDGGHLLWTAASNADGYGRIKIAGRDEYAHRVAWVLAHRRPIPEGLTIGHRHGCPRSCCNPAHLRLASLAANLSERWIGRRAVQQQLELRALKSS